MRMKKQLVTLLLLVTGCAPSHPMGISDNQWNTMSFAQQQQAATQQAAQDEAQRKQQEAIQAALRQQQLLDQKDRLEQGAQVRLGITDAEWASFTPQKQLELRQQQEAIEREQDNAQVAAAAPRDEGTHDIADALREGNLQKLYTDSAYGNVVDCDVSGGNAKFKNGFKSKWTAFVPVRFSIARGDSIKVGVRRLDKQKTDTGFWVGWSQSQELEVCATQDVDKRYKNCRVYPITKAYEQGYTTAFFVPDVIDNAQITCRFTPGRK